MTGVEALMTMVTELKLSLITSYSNNEHFVHEVLQKREALQLQSKVSSDICQTIKVYIFILVVLLPEFIHF